MSVASQSFSTTNINSIGQRQQQQLIHLTQPSFAGHQTQEEEEEQKEEQKQEKVHLTERPLLLLLLSHKTTDQNQNRSSTPESLALCC